METGRLEAFSDGVFAIAVTLLILAVGIDQARASGSLSHQLIHLWPAYIAYAVSFVTVGIMWINHHELFRHFAGPDADPREVTGITRSYLPGAPLYGTATLIAFASPIASLIMFAAIALFYAISSAVFGRTDETVVRTASVSEPRS